MTTNVTTYVKFIFFCYVSTDENRVKYVWIFALVSFVYCLKTISDSNVCIVKKSLVFYILKQL